MWFFVCEKRLVQGGIFSLKKNGPPYPPIDILKFDCNKLKLEDDMKITYDGKPCKICMRECYQGPSSQKKHLFANNVDWFFGYGVENICKFDDSV